MSGEWRLTASVFRQVTERHDDGRPAKVIKHREGAKITGLSGKDVERLRAAGAIVPWTEPEEVVEAAEPQEAVTGDDVVEEPATAGDDADNADAPAPDADGAPTTDPGTVERPRNTATKKVWVDYAVSKGWTREDAEDLDKTDLIEAVG